MIMEGINIFFLSHFPRNIRHKYSSRIFGKRYIPTKYSGEIFMAPS